MAYSRQPLCNVSVWQCSDGCSPVLLQTKEDFPGTTKKLVDDIKTAGWEGGKVGPRCLPPCVKSWLLLWQVLLWRRPVLESVLHSQHTVPGPVALLLLLIRCQAFRRACPLPCDVNETQQCSKDTIAVHAVQDLKRGAAAVAGKAQAAFEDEVEPNYGILGWRHVRRLGCLKSYPEYPCTPEHTWCTLVCTQQHLICFACRCCPVQRHGPFCYTGKRMPL
jgi:hypothetical protein